MTRSVSLGPQYVEPPRPAFRRCTIMARLIRNHVSLELEAEPPHEITLHIELRGKFAGRLSSETFIRGERRWVLLNVAPVMAREFGHGLEQPPSLPGWRIDTFPDHRQRFITDTQVCLLRRLGCEAFGPPEPPPEAVQVFDASNPTTPRLPEGSE